MKKAIVLASISVFLVGVIGHAQGSDSNGGSASLFGEYVMTRETSGTSWQPDSSPHSGFHFASTRMTFMLHGFLNGVYTKESGPRGDQRAFATNMMMLTARRGLQNGAFGFRLMVSAEPLMGSRGYPLLLQTGETADGRNPLLDRQHPHDVLMELAGTWSRNFSDGSTAFFYMALAGEPPLGPSAFMHRASGADNPMAAISHHFIDSTHVTHGVVTVGMTTKDGVKVEAGVFNGREADQKRWGIQAPRLDSFAGRITVNPHRDWSFQFSAGSLNNSEQLHAGLDIMRITGSATYNRPLATGNWQTTFAWGRNKRRAGPPSALPAIDPNTHVHTVNPADGTVPQSTVQRGILAETAANIFRSHTIFGRFENADKDELFPLDDPRHPITYPVKRMTVGYIYDLPFQSRFRFGIGVSGSATRVPADLQSAYGDNPGAFSVFLRTRFGP